MTVSAEYRPTTDEARAAFLAALEETGVVAESCRRAGISRQTAYRWRDDDEAFAQAWLDAEEAYTDRLEQVAFERGIAMSDRLLLASLAARRPERWNPSRRMELTMPPVDVTRLSDEQLMTLATTGRLEG